MYVEFLRRLGGVGERDNVNDAGLSLAVLLTANSSVGCYREETRMRDFVS